MITIENVDVYGWEPAIRGARNPMNSWDKSDSYWTYIEDAETHNTAKFEFFMGENDEKLLRSLANAGPDHGKYLRFIQVYCDITAPLYWLKEMDTYRMGVEKNSCSTMHKIHSKEFTQDDFSHEELVNYSGGNIAITSMDVLNTVITWLNVCREQYIRTKNRWCWDQLIQLLPTSYNQRRTYMFSYAALRNMYHARKHHKLVEWREFCRFIESLPHSYLITGEE